MGTHIAKPFVKILIGVFFLLFTNIATAQKQANDVMNIAIKTVLESKAIKNLNREKGLHLFESASEGLQCASKNGLSGYMSISYDWVISPQYDFVFPFHEGFGVVFLKGQPMYVDKNGNIPFKTDFAKDLGNFSNGRALFRTHSGKMGILNKSGQLVGDTIFKQIHLFNAEGFRYKKSKTETKNRPVTLAMGLGANPTYALIDTNGRVIVPFGQFEKISEFVNSYATAVNDKYTALFDANGREVMRFDNDTTRAFSFDFPINVNYGAFVVDFKGYDKKVERQGIMNIKGDWLLNDLNVESIRDYDDSKAVVYRSSDTIELVYFTPKTEPFIVPELDNFPDLDDLKNYGVAVARVKSFDKPKYGIMDSCFAWRVKPQYDDIQLIHDKANGFKPYFKVRRELSDDEAKKRNVKARHEGMNPAVEKIANISGKILFDDKEFEHIFQVDSLFKKFHFTSVDGSQNGYIDLKGNITGLRENENSVKKPQNIKKTASFSYNLYNKDEWKIKVDDTNCKGQVSNKFGGISACNKYKKIMNDANEKKQIAEIRFSETDTFIDETRHRTLIKAQLLNSTNDTLFFDYKENQIYVMIQAQDEQGLWRNISFKRGLTPYEKEHKTEKVQIGLPPQYFWDFELPVYQGLLKTKCRSLIYTNKIGAEPIVSNTWSASINPAQFWKSPMYSPKMIFDEFGYWYEGDY
jgi:WG containing repeat